MKLSIILDHVISYKDIVPENTFILYLNQRLKKKVQVRSTHKNQYISLYICYIYKFGDSMKLNR